MFSLLFLATVFALACMNTVTPIFTFLAFSVFLIAWLLIID